MADSATPASSSPAVESWEVGAVRVSAVVELATVSSVHFILPDATAERLLEIPWAQPDYVNEVGKARMTIRSLIVESEGKRIIVDTCLGGAVAGPEGGGER